MSSALFTAGRRALGVLFALGAVELSSVRGARADEGDEAVRVVYEAPAGCPDEASFLARVRARMMEEITVEDKVNEEVRNILTQYQDEMRRTGISYQDMFKKVKGQLARDKKLILR